MQDAQCIHAFVASRLRQSWVLYMSNIQAVCRFSSASGVILLGKLDTCPARHSIESMHDLIGLSDATVPEPQLRLAPLVIILHYGRETSRCRPVAVPTATALQNGSGVDLWLVREQMSVGVPGVLCVLPCSLRCCFHCFGRCSSKPRFTHAFSVHGVPGHRHLI